MTAVTEFEKRQMKAAILKGLSNEDAEMDYKHPATGRMFDIRLQDDGSVFVAECVPLRGPYRFDYINSPNEFLERYKQHGFDVEALEWSGAGLGLTTIYHPSVDAAIEVIASGIQTNTVIKWSYTPEEYRERLGPLGIAQQSVKDAQASVDYWTHETGPSLANTILKGARSMLGPLSEDARKRCLAFFNDPCDDTWEEASRIMVAGSSCLWDIWCKNDPSAPISKYLDGPWPCIPDPRQLIVWVQDAISGRAGEATVKLKQAQEKLKAADENLAAIKNQSS